MRIIIETKNHKTRLNKFIDWLIYMACYAIVLIAVSLIFRKTIYIDPEYGYLWGFLAAVIIYVLNKTIKPVLVWLTLPITGLTLGIFYFFINVFILNITEFILQPHFAIHGIFMSFIVAICISIMNTLMETLVIEPLIRKGKNR